MKEDEARIYDKLAETLDGEDIYTGLKAMTILVAYSLGQLIQSERDLDKFLQELIPAIREDAVLSMNTVNEDFIH